MPDEEQPPLPGNDNFTKEKEAEIDAFNAHIAEQFAVRAGLDEINESFGRLVKALEDYVSGPVIGRERALAFYDKTAEQFELLGKRYFELDGNIPNTSLEPLAQRMESVLKRIEALP